MGKFNRFWYRTFPSDPNSTYSVVEDDHFVCSGLSWLQATEFCKGRSLSDLGINLFSLF